MLTAIGEFAVRRRRAVLVAALGFFVVSGVFGANVEQHLSQGGFEDPRAESTLAAQALAERFDTGPPNIVLLIEARQGTVDAPEVVAFGTRLTQELAGEPTVAEAVSYWTLGRPPPLRSDSGDKALVLGRIRGDRNALMEHVEDLSPKYTIDDAHVTVRVGGMAETFREVSETIEGDVARAEAIALPVTLLLLVLVFGSVVAAGLPVAIGALSIAGTFLILRLLGSATEVSVYSLSATTAMGLALAIDYSLFVVSRYREELRGGARTHEAVVRTVQTAGRTVAFGGMTVAISLSVLAIFPLSFLRSFAYAGVAVVAFAVFGAIVVLPALLAALGPRVDNLAWRGRRALDRDGMFWHRAAHFVMRRPVTIAAAVVAILLFLGAPFLDARFGLPDDRVLPPHSKVRAVHDELRTDFSSQEAGALSVVATGIGDPTARHREILDYAKQLSRMEGVARVDSAVGIFARGDQVVQENPFLQARFAGPDATWLSVVPAVEPISDDAERLVATIRGAAPPFDVMVAGPSAELVDSKAALFGRMPLAAAIIALVTFTCLFLMFGSVVVPAKAIVLNVLSLTATFGAMVWIFQDGHLAGVLDFTPTGFLITTIPILMFCVAFGLSMDYEVFLLSRMKEEHDRGADNVAAVAGGLERTGRIVTAAAGLMAVVFVAFATSGISFMKLFGIGLTVAVLMDATLVRAGLVPAFMRLAGSANWWAPAPLRGLHNRWGLREPAERSTVDVRDESGDKPAAGDDETSGDVARNRAAAAPGGFPSGDSDRTVVRLEGDSLRWRRSAGHDPKAAELGEIALFRGCTTRELRALASIMDEVNLAAGRVLFREGRRAYECFVIGAGQVEVRVQDRRIAVLGPGEVVGETALLDGGVRTATVVALTEVEAFVIERRRFDALLDASPRVARAMLRQLAGRLRTADLDLVGTPTDSGSKGK